MGVAECANLFARSTPLRELAGGKKPLNLQRDTRHGAFSSNYMFA